MSERERMARVLYEGRPITSPRDDSTWATIYEGQDYWLTLADAVLAQRAEPGHCDLDDANCCGACHHDLRAQLATAQEAREMAERDTVELLGVDATLTPEAYDALRALLAEPVA